MKTEIIVDNISTDMSVSVCKITYDDGEETRRERVTLTPVESKKARIILPDNLYNQVKELWTPEVIEAYKNSQAELQTETPEPGPLLPTTEQRLLSIEAALLEMAGEIYG